MDIKFTIVLNYNLSAVISTTRRNNKKTIDVCAIHAQMIDLVNIVSYPIKSVCT